MKFSVTSRARWLPCTLTLCALALATPVQAADPTPEGVVRDGSDHVVTDGVGECVRAISERPGDECRPEAAPAVARVEPPAPAAPKHYTFSGETLFDFDRATLRREGKEALDQAVKEIRSELAGQAVSERSIMVTGHTDSKGTEAYNQRLSQRRAAAVRDYLVRKGVKPEYIEARGMGEEAPVASNATDSGRQQNRRVEIEFSAQVEPKR